MRNKYWAKTVWPPVTAVVFLLLAWQASSTLLDIPAWILPSPLAIMREAAANWDSFSEHTVATVYLTVAGFIIGSAVGFFFSFLLHRLERIKGALYPLLIMSQNIPVIALAPLLMLWFGFGLLPKMIVITLVCFFPIAVSTLNGLSRTDPAMMDYMKMIGASRRQIFYKLELPYALPYTFAGLKISATYSVMGAIMAEWLGTEKGIGMYMLLQKSSFRTDRVFVAIAMIVALSLLMFAAITVLEKLLIRWNKNTR